MAATAQMPVNHFGLSRPILTPFRRCEPMSVAAKMSPLVPQLQTGDQGLAPDTQDFVRNSLAEASQRALRSDLEKFLAWGGVIPATAQIVANYLAAHAGSHKPATLARWTASISKAHRM